MQKMSTVEARENFSELINQAAYGKKRVLLTRRGKPLVALIPLEDLEKLESAICHNSTDPLHKLSKMLEGELASSSED